MPGRAQGVEATQCGDGAGRRLFVAVLAAACAFGVALPDAGAQEQERPGLGELLPPLAPDDDAEADAPPATTPPSAPEPAPEPAPGPGEEPPPPPPEGGPPPEAAPAEADVQGAQAAPRQPRAGSAYGPGLQSGGPPPGGADDVMPLEVAAPSVAPPEAGPQAAPPAGDGPGQEMAARPTATGAYPSEPAMPDLAVLGLLALGLMWFDRRYRARYRLPPR